MTEQTDTLMDDNAVDTDAEVSEMADQSDVNPADTQAGNSDAAEEDDPWASALAEQDAANQDMPPEESPEQMKSADAVNAGNDVFRPIEHTKISPASRDLELIMDIPVRLNVELGRTRISIKKLLELTQGSVLELDGLAGDPMDILINGYHIAQGEVVVVEDRYGIRITNIITPSERVNKLNG